MTRAMRMLSLLTAAAATAGCSTVGSSVAAALGGGPDPADFGPGSRSATGPTSVYQKGPTIDWRGVLRTQPSAARSEVFEARLFDGMCPGVDLASLFEADPFGSHDTAASFRGVESSHGQWGDRGLFEPVPVGGPSPQLQPWQGLDPPGLAGGRCRAPGLPVLAFGPRPAVAVSR